MNMAYGNLLPICCNSQLIPSAEFDVSVEVKIVYIWFIQFPWSEIADDPFFFLWKQNIYEFQNILELIIQSKWQ